MKLDTELIKYGINENIIRECHAKTKMADFEIEEVIFCKKMNDSILIRLTLFLHIDPADYRKNPSIQRKKMLTRKTVLEISISKIREKKLSVILG